MKTYRIRNLHGQYWTGTCWGVKQAAEHYTLNELPLEVNDFSIDTRRCLIHLDEPSYFFEGDDCDFASLERIGMR